ncbi:MAG: transcription antitermination factor NusB [Pseudomonadota bacterium]
MKSAAAKESAAADKASKIKRSTTGRKEDPKGLTARLQAAKLIYAVTVEKRSLEAVATHSAMDSRDRALSDLIVLTALRNLVTIDKALDACLSKPLPAGSGRLMSILRALAAQVLFTDLPDHAAVQAAVTSADQFRETGKFKGLVNALGRRLSTDGQQLISGRSEHELPNWLAKRWRSHLGDAAFRATASVLQERPPLDLSFCCEQELSDSFESFEPFGPIRLDETSLRLTKPGPVPELPKFKNGSWWVQDIAASLPAKWLISELENPAAARVLDACAAPGGKTAQLAAAGADVTALDASQERMRVLKANMARLNLPVQTIVDDLNSFDPKQQYDAVLLDAPCSATGTLRRNPDVAYLRKIKDVKALAAQQTLFIARCAPFVRVGGLLLYATCSLEPEEGEHQLEPFLAERPDWQMVAPPARHGVYSLLAGEPYLRTFPGFTAKQASWTGMDGFFIACFRRVA